jgi:hypothetical protein
MALAASPFPLRFRTVTSSRLQGLKDQLAAADGD